MARFEEPERWSGLSPGAVRALTPRNDIRHLTLKGGIKVSAQRNPPEYHCQFPPQIIVHDQDRIPQIARGEVSEAWERLAVGPNGEYFLARGDEGVIRLRTVEEEGEPQPSGPVPLQLVTPRKLNFDLLLGHQEQPEMHHDDTPRDRPPSPEQDLAELVAQAMHVLEEETEEQDIPSMLRGFKAMGISHRDWCNTVRPLQEKQQQVENKRREELEREAILQEAEKRGYLKNGKPEIIAFGKKRLELIEYYKHDVENYRKKHEGTNEARRVSHFFNELNDVQFTRRGQNTLDVLSRKLDDALSASPTPPLPPPPPPRGTKPSGPEGPQPPKSPPKKQLSCQERILDHCRRHPNDLVAAKFLRWLREHSLWR